MFNVGISPRYLHLHMCYNVLDVIGDLYNIDFNHITMNSTNNQNYNKLLTDKTKMYND